MKVGIWLGEYNPEAGGAFTLLDSIKKQIIASENKKNSYIFLYSDSSSFSRTMMKEGIEYINIHPKKTLGQKVARKLHPVRKILSDLDSIAIAELIDIFWFTLPVNADISFPYIFPVWDLGHRTVPYFPEVSRTGWKWEDRERLYKDMLFKASYIISGNETGKKEIYENYNIQPEKIRVIPFPVSAFCFGSEKKPDLELPEKFIFYPAQFWPHKNHIRVIQAMKILRDKYGQNINVVFTGSDKGNKRYIIQKIDEYQLTKSVFFPGFVSDEEMKYLYTHATCMVFASLMGPNNMPPIEATVLGCPVIITDLQGHKEQLGKSALYFNGCDPEELALALNQILVDPDATKTTKDFQAALAKDFLRIDYFTEIEKIINEFAMYRECWGPEYEHT